MKADLIIPTYRPDDTFCLLLQKLQEQTFVVHRVIILNTEEKLWKEAVEKYPIEQSLCGLPCEYTLYHISKEMFDHGGTRMCGVKHSDADIVIFIHRPHYYDPTENQYLAKAIVAKNRSGSVGTANLGFLHEFTLFCDMDFDHEEENPPQKDEK